LWSTYKLYPHVTGGWDRLSADWREANVVQQAGFNEKGLKAFLTGCARNINESNEQKRIKRTVIQAYCAASHKDLKEYEIYALHVPEEHQEDGLLTSLLMSHFMGEEIVYYDYDKYGEHLIAEKSVVYALLYLAQGEIVPEAVARYVIEKFGIEETQAKKVLEDLRFKQAVVRLPHGLTHALRMGTMPEYDRYRAISDAANNLVKKLGLI
jgi:hypothetical protein